MKAGRDLFRTRVSILMHHTNVLRILSALWVLSLPLAAQSLNDVFARLDKTAQQFKSVEANIKRDVHTNIIDDDAYDSGVIMVKREKSGDTRMLINFTGADAKTVSLEGSTVSIYYPKINTAQIYDVGARKAVVEQFLLLGFGASSTELKSAYNVSWVGAENIGGQPTGHILLVPKSIDVSRQLKQAELWIQQSNGLPAQQKITFTSQFWIVTYTDLKFNPTLSDDSLKLKLKKGVQVDHPK